MHCLNCDRLLTDYEATRKHAITFKFLDLCKVCFEDVKTIIPTIDRKELMTDQDLDVNDDDDDNCDLDTGASLEDIDALYSYVVNSNDCRDDYEV
jgi:hypothetical protein